MIEKKEEIKEEKIMVELDEKVETEEEIESETEEVEEESVVQPKFSEGFLKKYEGKTNEELIEILHNQEEFIGKQSSKIGKLQVGKPSEKLTSNELKDKVLTGKRKLAEYKDRLESLDKELDTEYGPTKERIKQLEQEITTDDFNYQETYLKNLVYAETAQDSNKELVPKIRNEFKEIFGLEFKDGEWESIVESTKENSIDAKLTSEDFEATLIRAYGKEKYRKMVMLQGGVNEREKIKLASGKEDKEIGAGTSSKGVNLMDMSSSTLRKKIENNPEILDKLSPEQLDKLYKKLNVRG